MAIFGDADVSLIQKSLSNDENNNADGGIILHEGVSYMFLSQNGLRFDNIADFIMDKVNDLSEFNPQTFVIHQRTSPEVILGDHVIDIYKNSVWNALHLLKKLFPKHDLVFSTVCVTDTAYLNGSQMSLSDSGCKVLFEKIHNQLCNEWRYIPPF